jgi:HAD superfamily hydrolase (TIGR01509 family)
LDIKLILFDFGGVIAPEGFQLGILKLGWKYNLSFKDMYEIAGVKAGIESGYTAGKIGETEYWKIVAGLLGTEDELFEYRYMFLDNFIPRTQIIGLIKKLRKDYKIGLFSDQTNWIYDLDERYDFLKYFDYKFISYDAGYTKQDDEFYDMPAKETGISPEQILLVDDKPRVIGRAEEVNLNTYLFTSIADCCKYFSDLEKHQ